MTRGWGWARQREGPVLFEVLARPDPHTVGHATSRDSGGFDGLEQFLLRGTVLDSLAHVGGHAILEATWKPKTPESNKSVSPNKLTMPPVAIECVRNVRQEALASFWEACHIAKQHATKPDHIRFLGFIEDLARAFDSAMETDKNRYGGT